MTMADVPDGDCGQLTWTAVNYENGATFEGFLNDEKRRQMFGRLFDGKHTTHDCEYRDGVMHGRGRTVCAVGQESEYIGGFDLGEKSGDGVFTCGDCCYVGPYSKGRRHGVGILKKGGSVLKQTWAKAHVTESAPASILEEVSMFVVRRHDTLREVTKFLPKDVGNRFRSAEIGRAEGDSSDSSALRDAFEAAVSVEEMTLPSGSRYKGDVISGNRYGVGEWSHPEGDRYVGEWRSNKKHGWGQYTAGGGQRQYDGEWVDDKMNGWGVSRQPDGVFVGTYTADSKSGAGVLFPASGGAPLLQQWEEGKMLNEAAALDDASKEYDAVKELIVSAVHKAAGLS